MIVSQRNFEYGGPISMYIVMEYFDVTSVLKKLSHITDFFLLSIFYLLMLPVSSVVINPTVLGNSYLSIVAI